MTDNDRKKELQREENFRIAAVILDTLPAMCSDEENKLTKDEIIERTRRALKLLMEHVE